MRIAPRSALVGMTLLLAACTGSQTGKALNAFDSKSFWETDYSEPLHSNSFWYSGYSDEQIDKAETPKPSGKDIWGNKASSGE